MKKAMLCSLLLTALASTNANAGNYAECLLDKLPGSSNEVVTTATVRICSKKYPAMFYGVEYGAGLSVFGFGYSNPDECTADKAKNTQSHSAAALIRSACMRLYTKEEPVDLSTAKPWDEFKSKAEPADLSVEEFLDKFHATTDIEPAVVVPSPAPDPTEEHYKKIRQAHPDADSLYNSGEFKSWIEHYPSHIKTLDSGSTQEVIAVFSAYKDYKSRNVPSVYLDLSNVKENPQPQPNQNCVYKSVMSKADYDACGITPP